MASIWPKEEIFKQLINRSVRKLKRDRLNKSLKKANVGGIVKQLNFEDKTARMYLPSEDIGLSRQLQFSSIREWRSTEYLIGLLKKKNYDHILDLGANLGYFVIIESLFSEAKITAVEPVNFNYSILKLNMSLNNLEEVDLRNIAVGSSNTQVVIYEFGQKNWSTVDKDHAQHLESQGYEASEQLVTQIRLDDLLGEFGEGYKTGLIRMDVEGFEYEILTPSKQLKENSYDLFVEFHSNILGQFRSLSLLRSLKECGYKKSVVIFNEEFSKDEQIFAYKNNKRHQFMLLEDLIKEFENTSDEFIEKNFGFELFLSKGEL
tara:strand:+ start:559 stop:1515 length:957 start_codon:yes stop_codon:yes gene_type:complete